MRGFRFICESCRKTDGFIQGIDYAYTRTYRSTRKKMQQGAFGEAAQKFLEEHPEAAVNAEQQLYVCPDCGRWTVEQDLSVHLPKEPRDEAEDFVVFTEDTGVNTDYEKALPYEHRCPDCGSVMEPVAEPQMRTLKCPDCGGDMYPDLEMPALDEEGDE